MLTPEDLIKLKPYINDGKVVNIEIKETKRAKEVMLEYSCGQKLIGDLFKEPFTMSPLTGITSIARYFARGEYGDNSYRGNCSGLLIKDLLLHFKPKTFADFAVGSGTSIEVARSLGYTEKNSTFSDLNPKYGGIDISDPEGLPFKLHDFIFFHPPYFVFEGSAMPVYSGPGGMWGDKIDKRDGSRIHNPSEFIQWFNRCNYNLYNALKPNGRIAILMGDSRYKGDYFSMFKEMNIYGKLENVIIKEQFNSYSDNIKYSGKFIPVVHEYLVVIRKEGPYIIPCTVVSHKDCDIRKSAQTTWQSLVAMILSDKGGKARKEEVLKEMQAHPKAATNNHIREKLNQTLQIFSDMFIKDGEYIMLAA